MEETIPDSRGYESDLTDKTDQVVPRAPSSKPFSQGGNWYRKSVNRRESQPYFKVLDGQRFSDTQHLVTLDNGHVLRKLDLAFRKNQPFAPSEFSSVPNILNTKTHLAGKKKRNSPLKRIDSSETGRTIVYTPTGSISLKRRKTKDSFTFYLPETITITYRNFEKSLIFVKKK